MVQTSYVSLLAAIATIAAATGSAATSVVIYSTVVNTSNNQITITGNKFSPSGQTGSAKATFGWISDSAQVCSTPPSIAMRLRVATRLFDERRIVCVLSAPEF